MSVTGLAFVATVSFLASRAAPTAGFVVALAGGTAMARAGQRLGARRGYGASIAAMLESVAIMGPARFGVPLTQAATAPMVGRLEARGVSPVLQGLACAAIRLLHNTVSTAFFIWVILGGLDAYAGAYDALALGLVPVTEETALAVTAAGLLGWAAFASFVQVSVYRRGLASWPEEVEPAPGAAAAEPRADSEPTAAAEPPADSEPTAAAEPPADSEPTAAAEPVPVADAEPTAAAPPRRGLRIDPRAAALGAALAFGLLVASTDWLLLGGVAVWLAVASLAARRADRTVVLTGVVLAAVLALGALGATLLAGLGLDLALRRALRAGLLVLVATWLRAAAGSEGLREVFRRSLHRLRRLPAVPEAAAALDGLGSDRRLAEAGRSLLAAVGPVPKQPLPVLDAVLGWVAHQSGRFAPDAPGPQQRLSARPLDAALVLAAALPLAALGAT